MFLRTLTDQSTLQPTPVQFTSQKYSNIFKVELTTILQVQRAVYSHDNFEEIKIFSDFKSSIQAISNYRWDASLVIEEITHLIYYYREAGTNVTFYTGSQVTVAFKATALLIT
jgi:hypothetical protein